MYRDRHHRIALIPPTLPDVAAGDHDGALDDDEQGRDVDRQHRVDHDDQRDERGYQHDHNVAVDHADHDDHDADAGRRSPRITGAFWRLLVTITESDLPTDSEVAAYDVTGPDHARELLLRFLTGTADALELAVVLRILQRDDLLRDAVRATVRWMAVQPRYGRSGAYG